MAIYHFTVKIISRSKGQSVVAASAYRAAEKLFDERLQKTHNYRTKQHVVHGEISLPENSPRWLQDISMLHLDNKTHALEQLWNCVEAHEKLDNSQLAREVEFALPIELNQTQAIQLAREFIQDQFVSLGMVANWNIHWEAHNPHVHVLLTMRELTDEGFGKKVRSWNQKAFIESWREKWAEYANFHLKLHQHTAQIDHRSYKDQGIDLTPGMHLGKQVMEMQRRGIQTEVMQEAESIRQQNAKKIVENPESLLKKIARQTETFMLTAVLKEIKNYFRSKLNISSASLSDRHLHEIIQKLEQHQAVFTEHDLAKALFTFTDEPEAFAKAPDLIIFLTKKISKKINPLKINYFFSKNHKTRSCSV